MFKLHKPKSHKFGEKLDFKLSNLLLLQVPRGWDKLLISVVSVETGKTITKSGKASVRNGSCQWTETLSESIRISQYDASKESEECLLRLVVAMGSGRFGILGEVSVNLASYKNSKTAIPVSLPLKKCSYGTILQVTIQSLVQRAKTRGEQWEDNGSYMEDTNIDYDETDNKSDVSDGSFNRSIGSSSSSHLDGASQTGEPLSRELSFSASGSRYSFDSTDGSLSRENFSPQRNLSGTANNQIGRQDSNGYQNNFPYGSYSFNDSSRSNHSSFNSKSSTSRSHFQNQRDDSNQISSTVASSPLRNAGPSKDLSEATEISIDELRAEARMWEKNSRKLKTDLEKLQNELKHQSSQYATLEMELSESRKECNSLKEEIEQLKMLLKESIEKERANEKLKFQIKEMDKIQKQFEDEVKFQKESNADLVLQLKKTQESNIEFVSILQELEDTIEKQKMEISNLSSMQAESKTGETNGLRFGENEEINPRKHKNMKKATSDSDFEGGINERELGVFPSNFEPENQKNLQLEILQLKESQKNLEGTIKFLEKSLEEKVHEIKAEQILKRQTLMECEAEWRNKLAVKEEEIVNLEAKLSEDLNAHGFGDGGNHGLIKEIEVLKQKMEDLEKDCNELTDENLELLHELKQSQRDIPTCGTCSNSLSNEFLKNDSLSTSESEVSKMKSQICKLEEELNKKELCIKELSTDRSKSQMQCDDLGKDCAELKLQLQTFEDKRHCLHSELCKYRTRAEKLEMENAALLQQLECHQGKETETIRHQTKDLADFKISDAQADDDAAKTLTRLHVLVQLCLANIKNQDHALFPTNTQYNYGSNHSNKKEQAEAILNNFLQLKDLLEVKVTTCDCEPLQSEEARAGTAGSDNVQNELEACNVRNFCREQVDLQMNAKHEVTDSYEKLLEKISGVGDLRSGNAEVVEALRHCQRELESRISNLHDEKKQLEENMEVVLEEGEVNSKCLDDLRNHMTVLNSSMDSQVSANKILVRKSSELESNKLEMEVHLSELEKENVQLSERISGLEAQLRYLTNERESSRLELQNSESCTMRLQEEIKKLQNEFEAQKVGMKQRLQDIHNNWLEAQEECDLLKMSNTKLKTTAESLIEECSLLQKSNGELKRQKKELFERYTVLESELRESKTLFSNMLEEVETLGEKYTVMLEEIASKEKALCVELEALVRDNQKQKEDLVMQENLLNQIYSEKTVEVDKLQREIAHLIEQISATHDEEDRTASDVVLEVSRLRADKAMLEASLQEFQEKLKLSERNLSTLHLELEKKLKGIADELAASKQNQEVLIADNEKLLNLMEEVKSNEEKHKGIVRGFNLKLKASDYEKLQVKEEVSSLKAELEKTVLLQNEILSLKRTVDEVKFENQRLAASFQILSVDYEELKAEKILSKQKIDDMQRCVSELENCKISKVALEEKVLRLEGDLTAREAIGAQNTELKNEIARVKREKNEFQRKTKYLEEEQQEFLKRAQAFELKLKQRNEGNEDPQKLTDAISITDESKLSQNDTKPSTDIMAFDPLSKIQALENELAEALEANEMYKVQLKSLLSERYEGHLNAPKKKSTDDDNETVKVGNRGRGAAAAAASLEAQLRDLQERYFHKSLKYAEVESEREQLVLKLKAISSNGRGHWYS